VSVCVGACVWVCVHVYLGVVRDEGDFGAQGVLRVLGVQGEEKHGRMAVVAVDDRVKWCVIGQAL